MSRGAQASALIDLRSDTVTRPSAAMRRAMAAASVGDDVYGEDPTVNALEARVAELSAKEAALFAPSGSMANLIAQMVHCRRGDEVIVGADSHCVLYEVGAGAAVAGVQYRIVNGRQLIDAADIAACAKAPTFHTPGTGLVWIENTHNMAGGAVYPLQTIRELRDACDRLGLPLHMDGARVFNAVVASGSSLEEIVSAVDSFSFCLSKGLGAPVGSVLCGSAVFREKALRLRKMLGGGMRQAGIIAAAGLFALDHHVERLAEDHENARYLAGRIGEHPLWTLSPGRIETNIVMARLANDLPVGSAHRLIARCADLGVLIGDIDDRTVRFVTHLDVGREQIERAIPIILSQLETLSTAR